MATTIYQEPTTHSAAARSAARNYQRKAHDFAVNRVGFGLLGRGYDVKPHDTEEFCEKYLKKTHEVYEPSPYNRNTY